jgi:hypothetical protein
VAENKTQPTEASVDDFLAGVEDGSRREDCLALVELMRRVTQEEPRMWGSSMVGFGSYHYRYASGREGDSFLTGFSPRKRELTLYIMGGIEGNEALLSRLGKHRTGKGCLYIKRLSDVDVEVLEELVAGSVARLKEMYGA